MFHTLKVYNYNLITEYQFHKINNLIWETIYLRKHSNWRASWSMQSCKSFLSRANTHDVKGRINGCQFRYRQDHDNDQMIYPIQSFWQKCYSGMKRRCWKTIRWPQWWHNSIYQDVSVDITIDHTIGITGQAIPICDPQLVVCCYTVVSWGSPRVNAVVPCYVAPLNLNKLHQTIILSSRLHFPSVWLGTPGLLVKAWVINIALSSFVSNRSTVALQ